MTMKRLQLYQPSRHVHRFLVASTEAGFVVRVLLSPVLTLDGENSEILLLLTEQFKNHSRNLSTNNCHLAILARSAVDKEGFDRR